MEHVDGISGGLNGRLKNCSACGACANICPRGCIAMRRSSDGSIYMEADTSRCIGCGLCTKVCPSLSDVRLNAPRRAYAAWAEDETTRTEGASGGIASVLYRYAVDSHMKIAGVCMDENFEARYRLGESETDIIRFRNSKYTYSYMDDIYKKIASELKNGRDVLFIGLPCQAAALKKFVALVGAVSLPGATSLSGTASLSGVASPPGAASLSDDTGRPGHLITADLVCHGTPPPEYLRKHLNYIEKKTGKKAGTVFFRDPAYRTDKFAFTVYGANVSEKALPVHKKVDASEKALPIYKKYVGEGDNYQIGYHKALIYQESCYHCRFAQRSRMGDLTLGDYRGLGKYGAWTFPRDQVSLILVNTKAGQEFINRVNDTGMMAAYERPVLEPLESDEQLNHPSRKPKEREVFRNAYIHNGGDYEAAANMAFKRIKYKNMVLHYVHYQDIRIFVAGLIPDDIKKKAKEMLKRR